MRSGRRTILILTVVLVVLVPICSAKAARGTAKKRPPQVLELLDKYASTQDKLKSFIVKTESQSKGIVDIPGKRRQEIAGRVTSEYRFDGDRFNVRWHTSQDRVPSYTSHLWDGNSWYDTARGGDQPGRLIIERRRNPVREKQHLSREKEISAWLGYYYGDDTRIDTILREAIKRGESVSVQDRAERIRGSNCNVIKAMTKRGKFTIWLDPKKDYSVVKAISEKRSGDLFYDQPPMKQGEYSYYALDYIQYKKEANTWVPQKAKWQIKRKASEGYFESVIKCSFTEVVLDPDHEALGSFSLDDVMNGATVSFLDAWDIKYTWQDGHLVDAQGFKVSLDPNQPGYLPVLVGKALPEVKGFGLELDANETKGKMVLVCFWDMGQRPSRNCVQELAKKAELLADRGVRVVLVQAETVDEEKLGAWLSKRSIALPVGRIRDNVDQVRRSWGLRSLPWLILADRKHIVTGEGFGLDELDEKIKGIENADR